jgi:membrane-associated phospholipid phosphatase
MNETAISNFNKVKFSYFLLPLLLLAIVATYLYTHNAWSAGNYISIQKEAFIYFNLRLSKFPALMSNFTQLGDALIILSLCAILIFYAPKIWESLIWASLISALLCSPFKWLFEIPRPAAALEKDSFVIIGKAYFGNNSLPSGHAITLFTVLTVLLLALMPKNTYLKLMWITLIIGMGILFSLSRVGVGAHYLLDVVIGNIIGYISGISGIVINRYCKIWSWIGMKRYYLLLIILFMVCSIVLIQKMLCDNLLIFYFSLLSLFMTTYILIKNYVTK